MLFLDTTIFRIDFEAITCKDYYLVPGCPETFIPAGRSLTIFGQLQRNKRWRCVVNNDYHLEIEKSDVIRLQNDRQSTGQSYPLLGSIPSSIIAELNEGISLNVDHVNDEATSEAEESSTDTDTEDYIEAKHANSFLCKCGRHLPPGRNSLSKVNSQCSFCQYCAIPTISSSVQTITAGNYPERPNFQRFSSVSSISLPTLPESPTETTIAELNTALESLAKITPRSRPFSGGSDGSSSSWTSDF